MPTESAVEEDHVEDEDSEEDGVEMSEEAVEAEGESDEEPATEHRARATRHRTRNSRADKAVVEEVEAEPEAYGDGSSEEEVGDDEVSADETNESIQVAVRNNCVYCGQDEDHDPNPEFEENLACAACGDNAHRQCAREAETLISDADAVSWRCPNCVENDLQPDSSAHLSAPDESPNRPRRRSSTSRFTRDLLPAARGISRPGSHSVFNTLILDDDPLDGSRSLRKRKATSEIPEIPEKRPRTAGSRTSDPQRSPERILEEKVATLTGNVSKPSVASSVEARSRRSSRTPKLKYPDVRVSPSRAKVLKRTRRCIEISLRVPPDKLKAILKKRPKPSMPAERPTPTPFYAFHERENDELKSKPYGGILTEDDAETTKTLPLQSDRQKFNDARERAEDERKERAAQSEAEQEAKGRPQKLAGPPSKIKNVFFGGYEIETWYAAPYPEEYSRNKTLYLCEFCLKYMSSDFVAWRHNLKCPAKHPPGDEIYRDKSISIFEIDGRKNPVYCQNLCLLAKLFLGSKTLYYDVEPFLFYVMTECDDTGCHFVGYFSKEKRPSSLNNVSCILTLPTHQRKGYGNLLISFSYLLTRVEGKTGSPEKPLSDMGLVSYRNYWRLTLSYILRDRKTPIGIPEISDLTGMTADDIIAALEGLRALVRDPVTKTYALRLDFQYFEKCISEWEAKGYVTVNPDNLVWTPYIMGRSNRAHYETAPPLPTVAPREDEDEENGVPAEEGVQAAQQADSAIGNAKVNGHPSDEALLASQLISTPKPSASSPIKVNGTPQPDPVPPTRYEIFPPLPGTLMRSVKPKKGGWRPKKTPAGPTPGMSITPSMAPMTRRRAQNETPTRTIGDAGSSEGSVRRSSRRAGAGNTGEDPPLTASTTDGAADEMEVASTNGVDVEGGDVDAEADIDADGEVDEDYEGGEEEEEEDEDEEEGEDEAVVEDEEEEEDDGSEES